MNASMRRIILRNQVYGKAFGLLLRPSQRGDLRVTRVAGTRAPYYWGLRVAVDSVEVGQARWISSPWSAFLPPSPLAVGTGIR